MKKYFFLIIMSLLVGTIAFAQELDRVYNFNSATIEYNYNIFINGQQADRGKFTRYIKDKGAQEAARQQGVALNLRQLLGGRSVRMINLDEDECRILPVENAKLVYILRIVFNNAHHPETQQRVGYQQVGSRQLLGNNVDFYELSNQSRGITINMKGGIVSSGNLAGLVLSAEGTLKEGNESLKATIEATSVKVGEAGPSSAYQVPDGIRCK